MISYFDNNNNVNLCTSRWINKIYYIFFIINRKNYVRNFLNYDINTVKHEIFIVTFSTEVKTS